jgi:L-threonylcarbamoyladenylate synthase
LNVISTEVIRADHPEALERAMSILNSGGLIAFPTDTVYGLAANAWAGGAVSKLYEAKVRSELKSIPVLIHGASAIEQVAAKPSKMARALAEEYWPGALTIVVQCKDELPSNVSASGTVGIRAPDQEFALLLLRSYGPLATTSATPSGKPDATTAAQVVASLGAKVDLVLDGGESKGGMPSTVVDATASTPTLIREGPISIEAVLKFWESY